MAGGALAESHRFDSLRDATVMIVEEVMGMRRTVPSTPSSL